MNESSGLFFFGVGWNKQSVPHTGRLYPPEENHMVPNEYEAHNPIAVPTKLTSYPKS